MKLYSAILSFTSVAMALPNGSPSGSRPPKSSCSSTFNELATFDDIPGITTPTLTNRIPIPYKSLYWQGFNYVEIVETNTLPGVDPHSGNDFAVSNALINEVQGTASWTSINYPGSTNKTFSLESFWYGCVLSNQNGATAEPVGCNIAFNAFKQNFDTTQQEYIGSQYFSYDPSTQVGAQQQAFGTFNQFFQDITYVLIQYTIADEINSVAQALLGMDVDDVKFTVCEVAS